MKKTLGDLNKKRVFALLVLLVIGLSTIGLPVYAKSENKTVKVGIYELEGFHSFEQDGTCVGYDIDYLNRIANVTGWKYKFIRAESWTQALEMLNDGKIDLLSPSQMTTERLNKYKFSTFPIGKVYAAILTLKDNKTVYEDFDTFNKMTFGIESGNTYTDIFKDYAKSNNFTPNIKFFDNHQTLTDALHKGEVDAIIANVMRADSDMRLLGKAGTAQFYYMYRKNNEALGKALNEALDQIEIDEPNFQSELVNTYFPIYNDEPFSKTELDYAKSLPTIRVACSSDARPYSYIDNKSKGMTGIVVDYLKKSGASVGLKYEFVPLKENPHDSFYKDNKIDLVVESGLSPLEKNRGQGIYSNNILNTQQLIVCSPKVDFSMNKKLTIAWFGAENIGSRLMQNSFPNFNWVSYESTQKCFDAVRDGEVDGCMVNQFAANWYLAMPQYEDLIMMSNSSIAQSICLKTVSLQSNQNFEDTTFMRVLNKSFKQISDTQEQQIIITYTTAMPYKLTLLETLFKYRVAIILLFLLISVVVVVLIVYAHNRNFKAQRDQMTELYNRNSAKRIISKHLSSNQHKAGALVLLDLDNFKSVNDTLGHQAGDKLLIETAEILSNNCRSCDIVCRLGGDEFLLYFPCNDPETFLQKKLEQFCSSLDKDLTENGETVHVSSSIGAALVPQDGKEWEVLYKHADEALYHAKENGKNQYAYYKNI